MNKYVLTFIILIIFFGFRYSFADTVSELQNKIEDRSKQIQEIEEEIKQYTEEVNRINKQSKTLSNAIKSLDTTQKKISADLNLTTQKINRAELTIEQLNNEIYNTGIKLSKNREIVANTIRTINQADELSLISLVFSGKSITEVWEDLDSIKKLQYEVRNQSNELTMIKKEMEDKNLSLVNQKRELTNYQGDLVGQRHVIEENKKEKNNLLNQTKNQEQAYRTLIQEKEREKDQFEKELFEYESQLKIFIDPTGYPSPRNGILSWPLDNIYITQSFGRTVAAQRLYVSGSHNGVDFRASIGTKVKSVLDGVVVGTGNTDAYRGCYSFGKWVMVKHPNGLSTIYAHLSVISVSPGVEVRTGDTIGFTGNTGYSTGPHLHLGLYATQGVRIEKHATSRGCKEATMPLADIKAYLDPLPYLPAL